MKYFWKNLVVEMPDTFNGTLLDLVITEGKHEWLPFVAEENGEIKIVIGKMA